MGRKARMKSESGIYHVMLRGINKQQIFFDEQDYFKFIKILTECKTISGFELYAYCLMDNHIHLLIGEKDEQLSLIMKRIECRFVFWYNAKYQRVGHLFQDRFRSEVVENDEYFLCVLRYIHQNPVKAGITDKCRNYEFSSYRWYYENGILVNKEKALSMISFEQFSSFHNQSDENHYLEISETKKSLTDEMAEEIFNDIISSEKINDMKELGKKRCDEIIKELKNRGLNIRQITTNSGLKKSQVEKVK